MVLLVVDTQEALVNESLYHHLSFVENIHKLIPAARNHGVEVIYVIHDDGPESTLTAGKPGFNIFKQLRPEMAEKVFIKNFNSAFRGTGLTEYLKEQTQQDVMVVGLQTDKCLNATILCGFEHGFHMIVPMQANTTADNEYMSAIESWKYYNEFMWPNRYARCISVEEALREINCKNTPA